MEAENREEITPYDIIMLLLSLYAIGAWGIQLLWTMSNDGIIIFQRIDIFVCILFFFDFVRCFVRAPRKINYLYTWGWIDLLASIPSIDVLRWGRQLQTLFESLLDNK